MAISIRSLMPTFINWRVQNNMEKAQNTSNDNREYRFDPLKGFYLSDSQSLPPINDIAFEKLPPLLRALLVTDGTVTRFLEAYLWEPIQVECLSQEDTVLEKDVSWLQIRSGSKVFKRHVLLKGVRSQKIYTFAESLIRIDRLWEGVREDLLQGRLGMGDLLRDRRMETYRELLCYGREDAGSLSPLLKIPHQESVLSRSYRIYNKELPTILITEKFPEQAF